MCYCYASCFAQFFVKIIYRRLVYKGRKQCILAFLVFKIIEMVELLPYSAKQLFNEQTWKELQKFNGEFIGIPAQGILDKGLGFYNEIKDTVFDNEIFRYIAGQDDSTPQSYTTENGRIVFKATAQGDGRVPWDTIPASLSADNIYYVPADHGNIPKYEKGFEGFKELLTKGNTSILSNTKPATRGGDALQIMPDSDFVTMPSENELIEAVIGSKEKLRETTSRQIINVSVTNGDLVHSLYPVVVGHFTGDGIIYAEKYLNRALNFKLSEYHSAGNYPGDVGTHLVILNDNIQVNENAPCKGGVVVGLGEFGSLTENRLILSLTQAFLTLAIKHNESIKNKPGNADTAFGISALLVGSDFAGLRINTSLKAIFLAVIQANDKLEGMNSIAYSKINCIEIIEIYQHKAIQVGRIINSFLKEDAFNNFKFLPPFMKIGSGALKVIPEESQQDDWHRLEISIVKDDNSKEDNKKIRPIRFNSITDKAHADEELLPTNRLIVDSIIQKIATHAQWNKEFSQTLYELLIPNDFKGYGSSLRNLVLIVDKETARYPWELLHDANGISQKPMVINTGIIRQLSTSSYRKHVELNTGNRALVIGNPKTGGKYPDLQAAKNEAKNVLNILQLNTLEVTDCIEKEDIEIVQKLLTQSYKIIHIASHGVAGKTISDPSGVVIGSEIIFGAADPW